MNREIAGSSGRRNGRFNDLTSDKRRAIERKKHLVDKVSARYGLQKDEAERQVDVWLDALSSVHSKKH